MEGYPQAAENFSKEANLSPQDDQDFIEARWKIRQHINRGNFESAIEALNEVDPEVRSQYFIPPFPSIMIRTRVIHAPRIGPSGPWMKNNHLL